MNVPAKCLTLKHNYNKELSQRVFESNTLSLQWYIFSSHLRSSPKGTDHKSATLPNWENKWSSCFTHKWALLSVNHYGEIYYLISGGRPLSNATRCSPQLSMSYLKTLMMLASFLHKKKKKGGFFTSKLLIPEYTRILQAGPFPLWMHHFFKIDHNLLEGLLTAAEDCPGSSP